MPVITRFAPSPTGYLHIGGARTALFNWLFSKHHQRYGDGGTFLLRIEDTDRGRPNEDAVRAIVDGLSWLGLDWEGEPISQFARAARHAGVARDLVEAGGAYYCYCTPDELTEMRDAAKREGRPIRYDGRWRDRDPASAPAGIQPVVRLKMPLTGETVIDDMVQGAVRVANDQLDDMVLLRGDGTPTYMLAVVVDDHDMAITHVIRGDDHLTNAFRQYQLYRALGWTIPRFAHIPLIHGPDGAKLSKRHGALGAEAYRDMGFLPETMRNYLLRLGWGHGDHEIISDDEAIEWFDIAQVGRSPARFDMAKLTNLNAHYLRSADDARLADLIRPRIETMLGRPMTDEQEARVRLGMPGLKERAKTLIELAENSVFYARTRPLALDDKAARLLDGSGRSALETLIVVVGSVTDWRSDDLEAAVRAAADASGMKLGQMAQPLRAALTGSSVSPPVFQVMENMGRVEALGRIQDACAGAAAAEGNAAKG